MLFDNLNSHSNFSCTKPWNVWLFHSYFLCFNFFMISNTRDDVISHAHGYVTHSEKHAKAPKHITLSVFFLWFNILTLIFITLCIDFVSLLKGQINLREFQNIEKFLVFRKKYDSITKGMHSYISNFSLNCNLSKKVTFNETPHFL